jgi:translation initiation factor IF-3
MQTNNQQKQRIRINQFIRVPQVRVIFDDGTTGGVMDTRVALKTAQDQGLDLIEINPKALPPVCKIADYGKMKYEEKKKTQIAKRNQQVQEMKELTLRPTTGENDLNHKLEQAKGFLLDGHKVKFTVRFRGREITHPQVGMDKIEWFLQQLGNLIVLNPQINMDGKFMSSVVSPTKSK